ncbi:hypothetical protein LCGC14_2686470 [marine sediment metagenome]|uniref:Homing endonuclease LAGLIDADG domain-containing protein n=1 Tax=marine sediment metagenome TaxID=412755 RepID=A0A0F8ZJV1_9ZZZZ
MEIKTKDIIWLGGLLEGEGCFSLMKSNGRNGRCPSISVGMTDEDVIDRISDIWGSNVCHRSNHWRTHIHGVYAIQWMMTLYSLFGKRRRAKIEEIIKVWKENTYRIVGMRTMATCHPDKPVRGFGMCQHCYDKKRRRKTA